MSGEAVDCPKCGDFICDACGGPQRPAVSQPPAALVKDQGPPKRHQLVRSLIALGVLALLVSAAGFIAKAAYRMFLFGWELMP